MLTTSEKFDTAGIAEYLEVTRAHVTDVLVKRPDFPRPIIDRGPRLRRWLRSDVECWAAGRSQSREAISAEEAR